MGNLSKICTKCLFELPFDSFSCNGCGKLRSICKKCSNGIRRSKYVASPRKLKYASNEERVEAARLRAREWYANNKDRAKARIKAYSSTEEYKKRRRYLVSENKLQNIDYWRFKKKSDKVIRRCRELEAGNLSVSSLSLLEVFNITTFSSNFFTCEYCSSIIGNNYHLEHLTPLSRSGNNELTNLAISCSSCNLSKGNKTVEEYAPGLVDYFKNRRIL